MSKNDAAGPREHDEARLPVVINDEESRISPSFWRKIAKVLARVPFAEDLLAAYYCAIDRKTPARVRMVLIAAIAYFVLPTDMIPDFILGFGFSDDATVLATAIGMVASHITSEHRTAACDALDQLKKNG